MPITSLERQCLSDEVYNQIVKNILSGEWKEGDKLPSESELCTLFNVSRVSIRSAIQNLKGQRLIVTKHGVGSFVSSPLTNKLVDNAMPVMDISESEYLDVLEFRQAIEFKAIDLLIVRASEDDLRQIEDALNQMILCRDDYTKYTDADFNFHLNIVKASKNKLFYNIMLNYKDILYRYLQEMGRASNDDFEFSINNHKAILEALRSRNAKKAKQIITASMDFNLTRFEGTFKKE